MAEGASASLNEVDLLVVGTGAGAMTAAIVAAKAGLKVLMVEKSKTYGGASATSGGGLWIPCNHLMPGVGIEDNEADAITYMSTLSGKDAPLRNVEAFVKNGPLMLRWMEENTEVKYIAMAEYADYYQDVPGARPGARAIDPIPYDARKLGADFADMQAPHQQLRVMGMMGYSNTEGAVLLQADDQAGRRIFRRCRLAFQIQALAAAGHGQCADRTLAADST